MKMILKCPKLAEGDRENVLDNGSMERYMFDHLLNTDPEIH